jgi:F-type H+-transporting ATPase subunit b
MTTASIFLLPNGTFIVELIIFVVLVVIIGKKIIPPINAAMTERQGRVRASLDAADQARADAAAADDERRAVLEEARQEAREVVAQANRSAEAVRVDFQTRGQAEFERIVGTAEAEVARARQRAVEEAAGRLGDITMDVVERVIGRRVDAAAHDDLIAEAVSALREDATGGAAAGPGAGSGAGSGARP